MKEGHMTNREGVIVYFAELAIGARFLPLLLGAEGRRVYTKIEPRIDHGLTVNAESDTMVAHIPDSSRVLPLGESRPRVILDLAPIALAALQQRAADAGMTLEAFTAQMMDEILGAAGVVTGGSSQVQFYFDEGVRDGANNPDQSTGDHVSGVRDL
jgi:hypothetical protein